MGLGNRFAVRNTIDHWMTPVLYALSDIYVLPADSVQETFCSTVAEAMSCGLPVLASDWDGMKDTVISGETGYLTPTYFIPGLADVEAYSPASSFMTTLLMLGQNTIVDPVVFKQQFKELLTSRQTRERLGAAGRDRVLARFTSDHVCEAHRHAWTESLEIARAQWKESGERPPTGLAR